MNAPLQHGRSGGWLGITLRTALLAWAVATVTLLVFVLFVVPWQRQLHLDNLRSKAYAVAVSLGEIAAGAVVSEDYSSVVDHCIEMLRRDPTLGHIVITRNDGYSLVHTPNRWDVATLDARWHPVERTARGEIGVPAPLGQRVFAYAQPLDYNGVEWGWIHVGLTLEAYDAGIHTLYVRTALSGALCLAVGFLGSLVYARHLVRPIVKLQRVVQRVAGGDLSARAEVDRQDELGRLAQCVNTMTESLLHRDHTLHEANEHLERRVRERTRELEDEIAARETAHRELADTQQRLMQLSREAGMAEVATGILHNVGNVLNSVNVSSNLLREEIQNDQRIALLKQTADLLRAQGDGLPRFLQEDPRGRLVPHLVMEIADELVRRREAAGREFASLAANIEHIKQIVSVQQRYAKVGGLHENVDPADLFADALAIDAVSVGRHGIAVERDLPERRREFCTDRHLALQILVNLLKNAIQACKARPPGDRRVVLRLSQDDRGTRFTVEDNGVGISPEDRQRIFQHGFTTRRDGHGFGLHSGALAARTLGGSLDFESEGRDKGARFTLSLPHSPASPLS